MLGKDEGHATFRVPRRQEPVQISFLQGDKHLLTITPEGVILVERFFARPANKHDVLDAYARLHVALKITHQTSFFTEEGYNLTFEGADGLPTLMYRGREGLWVWRASAVKSAWLFGQAKSEPLNQDPYPRVNLIAEAWMAWIAEAAEAATGLAHLSWRKRID